MSKAKKGGSWLGHPLLDEEHGHNLHLQAAVNEFQAGMPRDAAEKQALESYRREHHARAAAHHLGGVRAANAIGDTETAQKHHSLYSLHVKALGEEPVGPVPDVVRKYHDAAGTDKNQKRVYNFRGHDADQFLVKPVQKSEVPAPIDSLMAAGIAMSKSVKADLGTYFADLQKGDVVKFPTERILSAPAQGKPAGIVEYLRGRSVHKRPADWVPQSGTCMNENCPHGNERYADEKAPGYDLCPGCLDSSMKAAGKPGYDPMEYKKQGFKSPVDMNRAKVGSIFEEGAKTMAEQPKSPHLSLVPPKK